ncbi:hypothetical protein Tco_1274666 [Tanacetum coccineum]
MGIVVSTVHGAIKFHTPRGISTIFSEYNSKSKEEEDIPTNKHLDNEKNILSCIDTKERMVINDKYPEQKITIRRQLPTRIKIRLRDLLKRYIDVFAWTSAHITGVPRVIMIGGETFNTEHRINVFNHAEPVKQKKRSLAPERNEAIHNQVEELTEAGILATYQKLIDKVFSHQMGRNMEVNADDMSRRRNIFGPSHYEARHKGRPLQGKSCINPATSQNGQRDAKPQQKALRRFLSKSAEKTLPFMKTLKSYTSEKMVQ